MILEKKKKSLCNAETGLEELVSRHPFGVATWLREGLSLVEREVATRKWRRDLAGLQWVSGLSSGN